jgi:hypothetical protein
MLDVEFKFHGQALMLLIKAVQQRLALSMVMPRLEASKKSSAASD